MSNTYNQERNHEIPTPFGQRAQVLSLSARAILGVNLQEYNRILERAKNMPAAKIGPITTREFMPADQSPIVNEGPITQTDQSALRTPYIVPSQQPVTSSADDLGAIRQLVSTSYSEEAK